MKQQIGFPLIVVATLCLTARSTTIAAQESIEQRWAVLVGVNDYAELEDLQFCKNDARALAEQLARAGFPEDNVFVLTDGASDAKDLPTKANIEARIKNVLSVANEGELVLVSFSGHGMHLDGKTYLCPTGARVDDPERTMIQLGVVYDNLNRCKATRKLLWVDACRDDPRQGGSKSAVAHAKSTAGVVASLEATPKGILTLTSCSAGQISWEDQMFGHGVFMQYLLEGLSGKADREETGNRNDRVSLLELYNYANVKTRRFVVKEKDKIQTPELFGRITGDFDIVEIPSEILRPEITNSLGMKLKLIPAGEFLMGSPNSDGNVSADEQPEHRVRITEPFYLGVTEVTQRQWKAVMKSALSDLKKGDWEYAGQGPNNPIYWVSWYDAADFCNKLSQREGWQPCYILKNVERESYGSRPGIDSAQVRILGGDGYRLPTEAEWEYACRAGTTTRYHWGDGGGDSAMKQYGWYEKNADEDDWNEPHASSEGTQPVQTKRPNAYHLYDMSGNVWEWCQDWYEPYYYARSPTDNPSGPEQGSYRVSRGGSWDYDAEYCRSANRYRNDPSYRLHSYGFRVARSPSGKCRAKRTTLKPGAEAEAACAAVRLTAAMRSIARRSVCDIHAR